LGERWRITAPILEGFKIFIPDSSSLGSAEVKE